MSGYDIEGNQQNDIGDEGRELYDKAKSAEDAAGKARDAFEHLKKGKGADGSAQDQNRPDRDGSSQGNGKDGKGRNGDRKKEGNKSGKEAGKETADSSQAISASSAANEGAAKTASAGSVGSSAGTGAAASAGAGTAAGAGASGAVAGAKAGTAANPGVGTAVGAAAGCLSGCLKPLLKGCLATSLAGILLGVSILYVLSTSAITLVKEVAQRIENFFNPDPIVKLADELGTSTEELYGFKRVLDVEDELYKSFEEKCNREKEAIAETGRYAMIFDVDPRKDMGDESYRIDLLIIYMMEAGKENRELTGRLQDKMNGKGLSETRKSFVMGMQDAVVMDATDFTTDGHPLITLSDGTQKMSSCNLNTNPDVMERTFNRMTFVTKKEHYFNWSVALVSSSELEVTVTETCEGKIVNQTVTTVYVDEHGNHAPVEIKCSFEDESGKLQTYMATSSADVSSYYYQDSTSAEATEDAIEDAAELAGLIAKAEKKKADDGKEEKKEEKTSGPKEGIQYPVSVASGQYVILQYIKNRWTQDQFKKEYPFDEMENMDYDFFFEVNGIIGDALIDALGYGGTYSYTSSQKRVYSVEFDPRNKAAYASAAGDQRWDVVKNAEGMIGWIYTQNVKPYDDSQPTNKYADPQLGHHRMEAGYTDCSSLVYRAFKNAGYDIGATTADSEANTLLSRGATVVARSFCDPQYLLPGDLIFYYSGGRYVHVSMFYGMDPSGAAWIIEGGSPQARYNNYTSRASEVKLILRVDLEGDRPMMVIPAGSDGTEEQTDEIVVYEEN